MSQIIDRRINGKHKSAVNRQRFLRRYNSQIRKAVSDAVAERSITDMEKGESIHIPAKDIAEPVFRHGQGGRREGVSPGNTDFVTGDRIPRPDGSGGRGDRAGNQGEGDDDFIFQLSREEFLDFFFADLALPDLVKTQLAKLVQTRKVRAGYTNTGVPTNINIVRSLTGAMARRIALRGPHTRRLRQAEAELTALNPTDEHDTPHLGMLTDEITELKRRIRAIPFIDTFDLRYNNRVDQPSPITQAVMFCIMDVSGSMVEHRKDIAKRFFILLYMFLTRAYERIDVVFIRHHTVAKEVDEQDFFYSRETGGTIVSSALQLTYDVIRERYPSSEWNIYAAQASDGDNWQGDSAVCHDLLVEKLLPCLQYFAYVEIDADEHQGLWEAYEQVKVRFPRFAMQTLKSPEDIYPVFRKLFARQVA